MPRVRRRRAWICMEALMRLDDRRPVGAQSPEARRLDLHEALMRLHDGRPVGAQSAKAERLDWHGSLDAARR